MAAGQIARTTSARIPTDAGDFRLFHYVGTDRKEHLALVMGEVFGAENVLARVHSECFTGDVLGSLRCDCGEQLHAAMHRIAAEGRGVIIYLRQEGRGIGLAQKLRAYNLQDEGYDTVDANLLLGHQADEREYSAAAAIFGDLDVRSIRLMTNNPSKLAHLSELGIRISERVPLQPSVTAENAAYLRTKVQRMQHLLNLPPAINGAAPEFALSESRLQQLLERLLARAEAHYAAHRVPFVTLSYAQSLDGSIAAADRSPLRLSGPAAMRLTHALRAMHDAILVGVGTVLADDPRLTVRLVEGAQPRPVILDSRLRIPRDARVFQHPQRPWIAAVQSEHVAIAQTRMPRADILSIPQDKHGQVDLERLLIELGRRGIRHVMVEGGAQVLSNLLRLGLANYAVITLAPRFLGGYHVFSQPDGRPASTPALLDVEHTSAGSEVILWGDVAAPQPAAVAATTTAAAE